MWAINHTLFGFLFAVAAAEFLPLWQSFALCVTIAIVWEIIEKITKAGEAWTNQIMDVVVTVIGFSIASTMGSRYSTHTTTVWLVASTFVTLELWGYAVKFRRFFPSLK